MVTIYVDGACQGNGKKENSAGFGVVAFDENQNIIEAYSKLCTNSSNNREELKAILYALIKYGRAADSAAWESGPQTPIVYSDSAYAVNTLTNWMFNWERNNWKKSDNQVPENLDLIQAYFELNQKGYKIDLRKIKGHKGIKGNEIADQLATGKLTKEKIFNIINKDK